MNNLSNDIITVIRDPKNTLGKRFVINDDGSIGKPPGVNVARGVATMHHVPDHASLAKLLTEISEDQHAAFINASFIGIEVGEPFLLYSEDLICKEFKIDGANRDKTKGIHQGVHRGKPIKVTGRLKENVIPSSWQYIDRDIDEHTPENYASLDQDGYIAAVDKLLPGFAKTDKVLAGSTSARVLKDGEPVSNGNGHIWFKFDNHKDVERVRVALMVRAAELQMTWPKPKYSKDTGNVCSHSLTTILDTSVFTPGRLVFVGKPLAGSGLVVINQTIKLSPGSSSSIDTSRLPLPAPDRIREITKAAGVEMAVSTNGSGRLYTVAHDLTMATDIETKDYGVITVAEASSLDQAKIKCQTPFRESTSLAAFLSFDSNGWPFVYDSGTSTTHRLSGLEICRIEFSEPITQIAELPASGIEDNLVDYQIDDAVEFMPHVVDLWVPCNEVTLLAGHGGGGKSYVALNLAVHVALGLPFGGLSTKQSNVLFFSGEDGSQVLKMRLSKLCRELDLDRSQLVGKLHILDASDRDPALHRERKDGYGIVRTETKLLADLSDLVKSLDVGFVIVDNASDAYDDDEIRRARVRAFIRSLRSSLARPGRAVMLLVHVNKASASNGRNSGSEDYSGSTAWHNSARSRLSLTADGDNFIKIEHLKANLGTKADPMRLEWLNGVPVAQNAPVTDRATQAHDDKLAILTLISYFSQRKEPVTSSTSGSATTYHVLHTEPGYPTSLLRNTSESKASSRLNTLCRNLVDDGLLRKIDTVTKQRKHKECYEVTDKGHLLIEASEPYLQ